MKDFTKRATALILSIVLMATSLLLFWGAFCYITRNRHTPHYYLIAPANGERASCVKCGSRAVKKEGSVTVCAKCGALIEN